MSTVRRALTLFLFSGLLFACQGARSDRLVGVEGALSYRERIALSPAATFTVRLFARDADGSRRAVAAVSQVTSSQVPLPFRLNWRRGDAGSGPLELEATISDGDRRWLLPTPVTVPASGSDQVLGLVLVAGR